MWVHGEVKERWGHQHFPSNTWAVCHTSMLDEANLICFWQANLRWESSIVRSVWANQLSPRFKGTSSEDEWCNFESGHRGLRTKVTLCRCNKNKYFYVKLKNVFSNLGMLHLGDVSAWTLRILHGTCNPMWWCRWCNSTVRFRSPKIEFWSLSVKIHWLCSTISPSSW